MKVGYSKKGIVIMSDNEVTRCEAIWQASEANDARLARTYREFQAWLSSNEQKFVEIRRILSELGNLEDYEELDR